MDKKINNKDEVRAQKVELNGAEKQVSSPKAKPFDFWRDSLIRYLGYANELGESFRPLYPRLVVHIQCVPVIHSRPSINRFLLTRYHLATCFVTLGTKVQKQQT